MIANIVQIYYPAATTLLFVNLFLYVEALSIIGSLILIQPIKRALDKRTVEVYTLFNDELNAVKKELTGKALPLPFNHPKFAGNGQWCRLLKKRIEREMMILDRAHFLPHMGEYSQSISVVLSTATAQYLLLIIRRSRG